jgi:predicted kinase
VAKVILLCGKICSGKSFYSNIIKQKENAVILSCDEIVYELFANELGDRHDVMVNKIKNYIYKKTEQVVNSGLNVILDFGFWSRIEREKISKKWEEKNILYEWHYVSVSDNTWLKRIKHRNTLVQKNMCSDIYVDEGLLKKMNSLFEPPCSEEIEVCYNND